MSPILKRLLRLIPSYRLLEEKKQALTRERDALGARVAALEKDRASVEQWMRFYPPGHFYSPLPGHAEIAEAFARGGFGPPFPAIALNEAGQFARLERFAAWYAEQPFSEQATEGRRYYFANPSYGHYDAIMLY